MDERALFRAGTFDNPIVLERFPLDCVDLAFDYFHNRFSDANLTDMKARFYNPHLGCLDDEVKEILMTEIKSYADFLHSSRKVTKIFDDLKQSLSWCRSTEKIEGLTTAFCNDLFLAVFTSRSDCISWERVVLSIVLTAEFVRHAMDGTRSPECIRAVFDGLSLVISNLRAATTKLCAWACMVSYFRTKQETGNESEKLFSGVMPRSRSVSPARPPTNRPCSPIRSTRQNRSRCKSPQRSQMKPTCEASDDESKNLGSPTSILSASDLKQPVHGLQQFQRLQPPPVIKMHPCMDLPTKPPAINRSPDCERPQTPPQVEIPSIARSPTQVQTQPRRQTPPRTQIPPREQTPPRTPTLPRPQAAPRSQSPSRPQPAPRTQTRQKPQPAPRPQSSRKAPESLDSCSSDTVFTSSQFSESQAQTSSGEKTKSKKPEIKDECATVIGEPMPHGKGISKGKGKGKGKAKEAKAGNYWKVMGAIAHDIAIDVVVKSIKDNYLLQEKFGSNKQLASSKPLSGIVVKIAQDPLILGTHLKRWILRLKRCGDDCMSKATTGTAADMKHYNHFMDDAEELFVSLIRKSAKSCTWTWVAAIYCLVYNYSYNNLRDSKHCRVMSHRLCMAVCLAFELTEIDLMKSLGGWQMFEKCFEKLQHASGDKDC